MSGLKGFVKGVANGVVEHTNALISAEMEERRAMRLAAIGEASQEKRYQRQRADQLADRESQYAREDSNWEREQQSALDLAAKQHNYKLAELSAGKGGKGGASAGVVQLSNGQVVKESNIESMYEQYLGDPLSAGDDATEKMDYMSFRNQLVAPDYRLSLGDDAVPPVIAEQPEESGFLDSLFGNKASASEGTIVDKSQKPSIPVGTRDGDYAFTNKAGDNDPKNPANWELTGDKQAANTAPGAGFTAAKDLLSEDTAWTNRVFSTHEGSVNAQQAAMANNVDRILSNWDRLSATMSADERQQIVSDITTIIGRLGNDGLKKKLQSITGGR